MTTRTEQLPAFLAPARDLPWRQWAASFGLTLLAVAIFGVAFAVGYAGLHAGKVLPGVAVGGVSLAGLSRPAAEAALRENLTDLKSGHVTVSFAERQAQIGYATIERDYNIAAMLDGAFAVGRQGSIVDQLSGQLHLLLNGTDLRPLVGWDDAALAAELSELAESVYVAPVDAAVVREASQWVVVPAVEGRTIDLQLALSRVGDAIDNISAADTQVSIPATVLSPQISTAQAQAAVDRGDNVTEHNLAVLGGSTSAVLTPAQLRAWVHLEPAAAGEWELMIGREAIEQWVAGLAVTVDRPAVEASFKLEGDGTVGAVPGQTGLLVDVPATTDLIYEQLSQRAAGSEPTPTLNMAMTVTEPEFTTAEAIAVAPRVEKVSEWTTPFTPSESNFYGGNIRVPTDIINGTVVEPGQMFDFWANVPSLSSLEGVGPGGIIIRGRTNPTGAIGGGICTCSTTLFNAALRGGFEMGARKNHTYYITRYPIGLDATVWRSSSAQQNMTFTNDTEYPLLIRGLSGEKKVTFEIWTVPTGRTVEFSEPIVVPNETLPEDYFEYTDELRPGEQDRVEYPIEGFESWVTRIVRDALGNVIHEDEYYSKYRVIHGITLVGRYPGDPPEGTRVLRAEFVPSGPRPDPTPAPPDPSPTP